MESNLRLGGKLALIVIGMFGFGYLLVPMYDVFCEITGLNGKTAGAPMAITEIDSDRTVTIEFLASVNQSAPWEFIPDVAKMRVQPGKLYDTTYF
ncbi:MAG: cytochrome c oxidase assembly protein, partial [Gammaproteobacteria bacterium]|nr:cytochrome c oxidase assembly protein [Gammaproteobacteria bacterium]